MTVVDERNSASARRPAIVSFEIASPAFADRFDDQADLAIEGGAVVCSDTAERRHAGDVLPHANYNDEVDPAVAETVAKLVDTTRVVELEKIDPDELPKRYLYRFAKRVFDIASCSCALVVCAIPMAVIAYKIKKDSPGPVFYKQERLGLGGRPITIVKFRSMYVDAEERGAQWAEGDDPRVTPIGKKIRANRLDELPQFWSVVKGDLSLIGPRPERAVFYGEFEKYIHGFSQRMMVKPGITGLAQVNGGYDLLPEEKIVFDLKYIKDCSFALDWELICKTIRVLFTHEGAR
ncbi:sugar transferase [Adlercreutzia sp. ZJ473]|uniref:sugar transferase n=1 Tax=Adlercreutzia sp. ZJ473 TaxID=2722822 RepID=UPI00155526EC|nr:sugar transferase [Adlercreutzia sp. ZJ473]